MDPSDCDVSIRAAHRLMVIPLSPAAFRSVFEGSVGWSRRMSSSSICSSGVVGCSSVTGTVSPRGISSTSWSPVLEPFDETSTTSGSG